MKISRRTVDDSTKVVSAEGEVEEPDIELQMKQTNYNASLSSFLNICVDQGSVSIQCISCLTPVYHGSE